MWRFDMYKDDGIILTPKFKKFVNYTLALKWGIKIRTGPLFSAV
jgi:hypothetical protein